MIEYHYYYHIIYFPSNKKLEREECLYRTRTQSKTREHSETETREKPTGFIRSACIPCAVTATVTKLSMPAWRRPQPEIWLDLTLCQCQLGVVCLRRDTYQRYRSGWEKLWNLSTVSSFENTTLAAASIRVWSKRDVLCNGELPSSLNDQLDLSICILTMRPGMNCWCP